MWRIDPVTGIRTPVSSNADPVNPAAEFSSPDGIAFEADGNLIVSDYATDGGDGAVFRVNPDHGRADRPLIEHRPADRRRVRNAEGVAIAPDRTIYVADSDAYDGDGGVFRVNPDTGQRTMISNNDSPTVGTVPDYQTPVAIAIDGNGDLLVAERMSEGDDEGAVIRVDPDTGTRSPVSANDAPVQDDDDLFANPAGIAVAPNDDIFVSRGVLRLRPARSGWTRSPGCGACSPRLRDPVPQRAVGDRRRLDPDAHDLVRHGERARGRAGAAAHDGDRPALRAHRARLVAHERAVRGPGGRAQPERGPLVRGFATARRRRRRRST